ncbi:MAG: DUF5666 domain-containing protein, partial [Anaerolineae bacterium]|nr:DUF5666 domain-containing protein [Anaerolineae bacterium]
MTPQTISLRRLFLAALALLVGLAVVLLTGPVGPAAADDRDDLPTWRGWIESQPIGTNLGTWVVGGRAFQADSHTEFDQEEGPLVVGACAKVKYQTVNGVDRAVEIDSEPPTDCGATATPTLPPGASPTPTRTATPGGQDVSVKARVDSMPAGGLIGVWVIGGVSYTTDANTVFRQDHGPFRVGACVEVEYHTSHPSYARKIATKSDDNCPPNGGATATPTPTRTVTPDATPTRTVTPTVTPTPDDRGGTGRRELYGVIESFPASLIGLWQIGGMTFVADAGTRFEQERAAFAVGVLVEVHFTTDAAGVNRALKIESTAAGSGAPIGMEGHAFGTVEAMPTGSLVGTWRIGGVDYTATTATRFKQNHGPLAIGAWVKVEYVQAADGMRTARKIETTSTASNPAQPEHAKAYGFVQQKPPTGFLGTWVINGIAYIADASTRFDETRGLLALGAYVEVEYIPGASNRIVKLETHVPPGAGPDDRAGVIQQMDAPSRLSAISAVWVIEGVSYQVLPATVLDDSLGPLAVGSTAAVNSYVDG